MGRINVRTLDRWEKLDPRVRAYVAASGKRFQCDLFGFWQECGRAACRRHGGCTGDPHACFRRRYRAMPRGHKDRRSVGLLDLTSGACAAEWELSRRGLPVPGRILPERLSLPPPRQADEAPPAVNPAHEHDASRRARREAGTPSKSPSEIVAAMRKILGEELGAPPTGKVQPEQAGPSPSRQADAEALVVLSERTSPASPDLGSAESALPAAGPSPPPAWRWTGPLNPPQAYCDEQGRLIMPDRTEYNERLRQGMSWDEVQEG